MKTEISAMPRLFGQLMQLGCIEEKDMRISGDGFFAAIRPLAEMMARRGMTTVPEEDGEELECGLFFDDWYLYAVPGGGEYTYSLFKMREQEDDAEQGRNADGDIPGVTVSFIALNTGILLDCLSDPTAENRVAVNREINRVVAFGGQRHDQALKDYFIRTEAKGPYLVAAEYIRFIASLARDGVLPVPKCYAAQYEKQGLKGRVARFLEENNRQAGTTVCDHRNLYLGDPDSLTPQQRLAILATHTGNTSLYSFAAEVQFHTRFLASWAKIPLPVVGRSPYASAIRADMSIGDGEFAGPTPYYRWDSKLVQDQYACHKDEF